MIKDTDIAWLAGIVDGEGCIYGHWNNRGRYATGGNVSVEVRVETVSLTMINRIKEICDLAGVHVGLESDMWHDKSTRPSHRINVRRRADVVGFLELVRPYLVVKGPEADVVLSWCKKWGDQRGTNVVRATLEEKVIMFDILRDLKKSA